MTSTLVTAEALDRIGKPQPVLRGLVSAADIAKFCSGIGEEGVEHHDESRARALGYGGIVAPP